MKRATIETADGVFTAYFSDRGLARLEFPSTQRPAASRSISGQDSISKWTATTTRALECALRGDPPKEMPPLDLDEGTEFQKSVWRALSQIPPSQTRTYVEIARAVGSPRAARAVGQACGANPIPVLIPCHRVLAAHGRLGGFSGGLNWKIKLLGREGVPFKPN